MQEGDSPGSTRTRSRRWRALGRLFARRLRDFRLSIDIDPLPGRRLASLISRRHAAADLRAGANVALLAFPQGIAYALVAGVPAQFGVFAAAIGGMVGPFFSGARFIVLGPTNATAILIFGGLATAGVPEERRMIALPLFVALVGLFQIVGSIARLSLLLNYVSRTVITAYVTAAAALIAANQLQNALGFRVPGESTFFGVLAGTLRGLGQTRWPELAIAAGTLATNLLVRRFLPRLPHVAVTLVFMGLVAFALERAGVPLTFLAGFSLGEVRLFNLVPDAALVGKLALPAMAVAFVAVLEGASVGKNLASRAGERLRVDQEIYAAGATNLVSSVFGGMDTSGSLTRSALAAASGARTVAAPILSGLLVALMLFTLGFLIDRIPRAALAVVVITIAWSLFNRHHLRAALRTTGSDAITFCATFGAALLLTLDAAIYIGALTSIVLFLRKAGVPELVEYGFNDQGQLAATAGPERRGVPGISILHAEGDLFFGSTEIFIDQTRQVTADPSIRVIILRLKNAHNLDATSVLAIEELLDFLRQDGRDLVVSGADAKVRRAFLNSGLLARLGPRNFFSEEVANPTVSTRRALKRASEILGRRDAEIRIFVDAGRKARDQGSEGTPA